MMMMFIIVIVTIVASGISFNFRRHTSALKDRKKMVLVDEEDSVTSETLSDKSDNKGYSMKYVELLNFFRSWCKICFQI